MTAAGCARRGSPTECWRDDCCLTAPVPQAAHTDEGLREECCCEVSPPEFGGPIPDRECPIHGMSADDQQAANVRLTMAERGDLHNAGLLDPDTMRPGTIGQDFQHEVYATIERILAARLAQPTTDTREAEDARRGEAASNAAWDREYEWRKEAEAELAQARADLEVERAKVAAVEALADEWEHAGFEMEVAQLRAALGQVPR